VYDMPEQPDNKEIFAALETLTAPGAP